VRQPQRAVLFDVGQFDTPFIAIPQCFHNRGSGLADDNPDFINIRLMDSFNHANENRFVRNRNHLLGVGIGKRAQACAFATTQD
jgi:hypothetical protein